MEWARAHGVDNGGIDARAIDPVAIASVIARTHVHDADCAVAGCIDTPCKKQAVCKALSEMLNVLDSPLKAAIREVAQCEWDFVTMLDAAVKWFALRLRAAQDKVGSEQTLQCEEMRRGHARALDALPEADPTLRGQLDAAVRAHADSPHVRRMLWERPAAAMAEIQRVAVDVRALESETREGLTNPVDWVPRTGSRPRDEALTSATGYLLEAQFTMREVAVFLYGGRVKGVQDQRRRHGKNWPRTLFELGSR